ncbi:ATP-dependent RNA helicase DDX19A-like [Lineus longissimus]|uniref:ATP-dependent RNA helicase DDX19A-like n=1 Tax=Lineus longissimus TaxID=88925 RepID=UPI002B4FA340
MAAADDDWALAVNEQESKLFSKMEELKLDKTGTASGSASAGENQVQITMPPSSNANGQATSGGGDAAQAAIARVGTTAEGEEKELSPADASLLRKLVRSKLVTTKADLTAQQKDPLSPLYSAKSFEELKLKPELLKGVYDMGFNAPSKIQETALPTLLCDPPMNMIAQSQSGTGKTAAFVLTMLSRVDPTKNYPQCLCLSPTYELALQSSEVVERMGRFMPDVKIGQAVRGQKATRGGLAPYHIIIGTPGTVLDWCLKFKVIDLKKITVFVLDEADVMIATQGHKDQSIRLQKQLDKRNCQMLLFSATYEGEVMKFAQSIIPNPVTISLRREEESLDNIKQVYITCQDDQEKFEALSNIYGVLSIGQAMIFCHTKKKANWLATKMVEEGHSVALLSGELAVEQRAAVISRFREGKEKVLITTNVSSRGIDIEQVTVVVNFDLPVDQFYKADFETYLHRIGRTGRFGKNGLAINMVDGRRSMANLKAIEEHFGRKINHLDSDDVDQIQALAP